MLTAVCLLAALPSSADTSGTASDPDEDQTVSGFMDASFVANDEGVEVFRLLRNDYITPIPENPEPGSDVSGGELLMHWGNAPGMEQTVDGSTDHGNVYNEEGHWVGSTGTKHYGLWVSDDGLHAIMGAAINRDDPKRFAVKGIFPRSVPSERRFYNTGQVLGTRHSNNAHFEGDAYADFNPDNLNVDLEFSGFVMGFDSNHVIELSFTIDNDGMLEDYNREERVVNHIVSFFGDGHDGMMGYVRNVEEDIAGAIYATWR